MMKVLKFIMYILLFLLTGELIVRIDMKYDLLNNSPKIIEVAMEDSELRDQLVNGSFVHNDNQLRILVIGDSYINGGGISPEDKFSKKLLQLLKRSHSSDREILVLDVSRPSNSTLDNFNSFKYYIDKFDPQYVFWAYNFNDILFSYPKDVNMAVQVNTPPKRRRENKIGLKKFVSEVYSISELTRYTSSKIQKQLKYNGIVMPVGEFHHLTKVAYLDNYQKWIDTQDMFDVVAATCQSKNSKFILYKMPEFNLLQHHELFELLDKGFLEYANSNKDITYFNGLKDFQTEDGTKFMLSKYDGHPNKLAHLRIAEKIAEFITSNKPDSKIP